MFYVYQIINLLNGKMYIGQTKNLKKRWQAHLNTNAKEQFLIHRAIKKNGKDNFDFRVVQILHTEKEVKECEKYWIAFYQTNVCRHRDNEMGYNLTDGGDGASGYKMSASDRAKLSAAKKGKYTGKDNPFFGKHHTKETKSHLSEIRKLIYQENKEKYNEINIKQCSITTEQCLDIQAEYLEGNISFEKLAEKYDTRIVTIHAIMNNEYSALKNQSIITNEMFQQIKKSRAKTQGLKIRKFNIQEELVIVNDYAKNLLLVEEIANKYNCSKPTISKILKSHNIKIRRGVIPKSLKRRS